MCVKPHLILNELFSLMPTVVLSLSAAHLHCSRSSFCLAALKGAVSHYAFHMGSSDLFSA